MSRYSVVVESATALAAGANFANVVGGASCGAKLHRVTLGVRAGAAAPTSQNMTVALYRATARGTATNTLVGQALNPALAPASAITGVDTAWSAAPTLGTSKIGEVTFNTQAGVDLPYELMEELAIPIGAANGICLQNVGNALPASHLYTATLEWEE